MKIVDLGLIDYEEALEVQKDLLHKRINGEIGDTLILAEHFPVLTLGKINAEDEIIDLDHFETRGIKVVHAGRGGRITYHAPGQLVLYPIIGLGEKRKDVAGYIDFLERTVTGSLSRFGLSVGKNGERRGIWAGQKKIGFIGVAFKRWVSYHGVCVNINNDITPFSFINPCGEDNIKVTSARELLGGEIDMERAKKIFSEQFARDLGKEYSTAKPGV
jgi:lipoyl(octanoyl) transferase